MLILNDDDNLSKQQLMNVCSLLLFIVVRLDVVKKCFYLPDDNKEYITKTLIAIYLL